MARGVRIVKPDVCAMIRGVDAMIRGVCAVTPHIDLVTPHIDLVTPHIDLVTPLVGSVTRNDGGRIGWCGVAVEGFRNCKTGLRPVPADFGPGRRSGSLRGTGQSPVLRYFTNISPFMMIQWPGKVHM